MALDLPIRADADPAPDPRSRRRRPRAAAGRARSRAGRCSAALLARARASAASSRCAARPGSDVAADAGADAAPARRRRVDRRRRRRRRSGASPRPVGDTHRVPDARRRRAAAAVPDPERHGRRTSQVGRPRRAAYRARRRARRRASPARGDAGVRARAADDERAWSGPRAPTHGRRALPLPRRRRPRRDVVDGRRRRRCSATQSRVDDDLAALFSLVAGTQRAPSIPDARRTPLVGSAALSSAPGVRAMWLFEQSRPRATRSASATSSSAVMWMGLLWFFNFVQVPAFAEMDAAARNNALDKLTWRALWWFRWAAVATVAFGLLDHRGRPAATTYGGDFWKSTRRRRRCCIGILFGLIDVLQRVDGHLAEPADRHRQRPQRAGRRRGRPRRAGRGPAGRDGVPPEHDLLAAAARLHGRRVALLQRSATSTSTPAAAKWVDLPPRRHRDASSCSS